MSINFLQNAEFTPFMHVFFCLLQGFQPLSKVYKLTIRPDCLVTDGFSEREGHLGFLLGDKKAGPFKLEVEWIKVERTAR